MNLIRYKIGGGETWKAPLNVKRIKAIIQAKSGNHVFAGAGHAGALQFSATKCWGYNANGQLGDKSTVAKSTPVAVFTSNIYRMLDKFVLKEVYIDVEPGREYQLTLGNAIVFGSEVIYYSTTERYNYEITLEYGT